MISAFLWLLFAAFWCWVSFRLLRGGLWSQFKAGFNQGRGRSLPVIEPPQVRLPLR
jgi:hypothetical protein